MLNLKKSSKETQYELELDEIVLNQIKKESEKKHEYWGKEHWGKVQPKHGSSMIREQIIDAKFDFFN